MPYKDPQKAAEQKRAWKQANPGKAKASARVSSAKWRERNPGYTDNWQKQNRDKANANKRAWRKSHPGIYKTPYETARRRMRDALRGHLKASSTKDLLGCSALELRKYLESKFKPGMTWENHGQFGWHIDHIRPCSSFDFSDPDQQRQCFHFSNLQPLWWNENLAKADSLGHT